MKINEVRLHVTSCSYNFENKKSDIRIYIIIFHLYNVQNRKKLSVAL